MNNRKTYLIIFITAIIIFIFNLNIFAQKEVKKDEPAKSASLWTFTYTKGEVHVKKTSDELFMPVSKDVNFSKGDIIKLGLDGYAEIKDTSGNYIRLFPDTLITIDNLTINSMRIVFKKGKILCNAAFKDSKEPNIIIETSTIVVGTSNGNFYFVYDPVGGDLTDILVLNGELHLGVLIPCAVNSLSITAGGKLSFRPLESNQTLSLEQWGYEKIKNFIVELNTQAGWEVKEEKVEDLKTTN